MSLIKSFNMKFLMQSLKKSKGIVIFSLIVVPLLTSLFLITISVESHRNIIVDFSTYELLDYILLYVIPFVFSDILFGYVFKKASTDFIGSMPVNRKTIFVTGTIGGIALITIMQILAVGIIAFLCLLLPSISLVGMPILNFLFMMLISYIFMFVATNLAMTISGTFKTQLIVTILIVFLVPVCFDICKISVNMQRNTYIDSYYYSDYDNYDLKIYDGNRQIIKRHILYNAI